MNWIFVITILAHYALLSTSTPTDFKLELLQVLFRHGDRTINSIETYPKDIYNSTVYEPYGYGQLTNKGKKREYELGKMLRRNYGDFLGETYKPDDVYAYSTDRDRTKMSLQLVLAGLYAPTHELTWNENLPWIPIPTNYNSRKFDFLLTLEQCPEFKPLFDEVVVSPEIQSKLREYKDFIQYLADNTGFTFEKTVAKAPKLHNTIQSQLSLGLPLPSWCTAETLQKMGELSALKYDVYAYTNEMRKLAVGPTIRRFLRNMDEQDAGSSTKRLYLYSAHDNNVLPFLRAHNFTHPRTASYGVTVVLEKLRGTDGRAYVRMLLWDGAGEVPNVLKLENCNEICPLSEYLQLVRPILPEGEGTECLYSNAQKNVENLISGKISSDSVNSLKLVMLP